MIKYILFLITTNLLFLNSLLFATEITLVATLNADSKSNKKNITYHIVSAHEQGVALSKKTLPIVDHIDTFQYHVDVDKNKHNDRSLQTTTFTLTIQLSDQIYPKNIWHLIACIGYAVDMDLNLDNHFNLAALAHHITHHHDDAFNLLHNNTVCVFHHTTQHSNYFSQTDSQITLSYYAINKEDVSLYPVQTNTPDDLSYSHININYLENILTDSSDVDRPLQFFSNLQQSVHIIQNIEHIQDFEIIDQKNNITQILEDLPKFLIKKVIFSKNNTSIAILFQNNMISLLTHEEDKKWVLIDNLTIDNTQVHHLLFYKEQTVLLNNQTNDQLSEIIALHFNKNIFSSYYTIDQSILLKKTKITDIQINEAMNTLLILHKEKAILYHIDSNNLTAKHILIKPSHLMSVEHEYITATLGHQDTFIALGSNTGSIIFYQFQPFVQQWVYLPHEIHIGTQFSISALELISQNLIAIATENNQNEYGLHLYEYNSPIQQWQILVYIQCNEKIKALDIIAPHHLRLSLSTGHEESYYIKRANLLEEIPVYINPKPTNQESFQAVSRIRRQSIVSRHYPT
ncbi:MAG: hypothetical protein HAW62_01855 [Endozoicomonadaceae bacterium]|nr:hypothetical protein [Endozoicomonadaceae bacterium]